MTPSGPCEVLIAGAGLAGSAAAITLARAGRDVVLLEREPRPRHKVCGEFLSQEALHLLRVLGLEPAALGAAPVHAVRLAGAQRVTRQALPFAAMSMTRKQLDAELLLLAGRAGVRVLRGAHVQRLWSDAGMWHATLEGANSVTARSAFLATGKHDMAGRRRPEGRQPDLVGLKMYYRLAPEQAAALAGHIELLLFRRGYGGLALVEDGSANLSWLVHREELRRLGGRWENLMAAMRQECPHLSGRLAGAEPLLDRPLAVSAIPYGYQRHAAEDGLWALGDQAAVIPSFTGDGMSIALHSGLLAAEMYLAGGDAASYQRRLHGELRRQVALATALSQGLLWRPSRAVLLAAVRVWPAVLRVVAQQTRIAEDFRLA